MDLTPQQRDWLEKNTGPHHYGEQDENGVDLSLIRANLQLSPLDRLRKGDRIACSLLAIQRIRNETPPASPF